MNRLLLVIFLTALGYPGSSCMAADILTQDILPSLQSHTCAWQRAILTFNSVYAETVITH